MELTLDNLVSTLTCASGSERSASERAAETQLAAWETVPGYHYLLQSVYLNADTPLQIRWMAIICFKNGVDRYWRPSKQNALNKEERTQIRARVFDMLHEPSKNLTVHNATAVARIARFDFPGEWPTLFDDIEHRLEALVFKDGDLISTNNLLLILNQVIKAVAAVRIGRARHAMQAKAPNLVTLLIRLYIKFFNGWVANLDLSLMEMCYACLKCLRRIIPEGFQQPHKNADVCEFVGLSVEHLQLLVVEHDKYSSDLLERYVKCYTKLYGALLDNNPTSFVLFPSSEKIISTFLSLLEQKASEIHAAESGDDNDFWVVLALKGFLILKKVLSFVYKKGALSLKAHNDKHEIDAALTRLTRDVFTNQAMTHLCDIIITWYLRLRPSDLERWSFEPEEWWNEELSLSYEYQIRPCAENFFQDLIKIFAEPLTPFVIDKITTNLNSNDILTQDAILCTFQLSSAQLKSQVSFDELVPQVFLPAATQAASSSDGKVVQRRVCLIIAEWVDVQCSRDTRKLCYDYLIGLVATSDIVVRMVAFHTLKTMVEDWEFNKQDFAGYVAPLVQALLKTLAHDVVLTESKLYIYGTLATLLERCNPVVDSGSLDAILAAISETGASDSTEPIEKSAIVRLLKSLTVVLNHDRTRVHPLAVPLIRACCWENTEFFTLLSEDGYDLWLAVLIYCEAATDDLVGMFDSVITGLMNSTEILPTIIGILRSYALLAPRLFLGASAVEMMRILAGYLSTMRDDAFVVAVSLLDIVALELGSEVVESWLESGLLAAMLQYAVAEDKSIIMANKLFLVVARLAKVDPGLVLRVFEHVGMDAGAVVTTWISYYPSNGNPRNRKINLMGLLALASYAVCADPTGWGGVALNQIVHKTFLFCEEVNESMEGIVEAYHQDYSYEDIDDYAYLDENIKPHGERVRYASLCQNKDPVYRTNIAQYLKECVVQVQQQIGSDKFASLFNQQDQYTIEKLQSIQ
ncbi:importin beta-like protein Kap120p [Diutina catenulata]